VSSAKEPWTAALGEAVPRTERSLRLFESDLLEWFTRTSVYTIVLFWVPAFMLMLGAGRQLGQYSWSMTALIVAAGVATWSLFEYLMHRFFFHIDRWMPAVRPFMFLLHGCHHADPEDASRSVMPIVGTIPLFAILLGLVMPSLGEPLGLALLGSFGLAYVGYDVTHYACHQCHPTGLIGRYVKRHHLTHHYHDDTRNFGVTSPLWDWLLSTHVGRAASRSR
jgi:sterol desaturase/sphingolipid hydroxylase (fatty acid hydroxylase superfamily)